jgi:hypothetical protein
MTDRTTPSMSGASLHIRLNGHDWSFPPARAIEVGRGPEADVRLDDERVSRGHVRIWHSATVGG